MKIRLSFNKPLNPSVPLIGVVKNTRSLLTWSLSQTVQFYKGQANNHSAWNDVPYPSKIGDWLSCIDFLEDAGVKVEVCDPEWAEYQDLLKEIVFRSKIANHRNVTGLAGFLLKISQTLQD